jgi:small subunit ribosomal protein S4
MIGDRVVTIPSYKVKVEEESSIHLTPESSFNQTLSKPESNLGSPETENLDVEIDVQSKNEDVPAKQETQEKTTV